MAFRVGKNFAEEPTLRIAAAHTDFPCLRIKPNPELDEKGYGKLNAEIYGGMLLHTWLDRPLSAAGKVALRTDDIFHPGARLVNFSRPLFTIPNLAIHMNRNVNEGLTLNRQKDMMLFQLWLSSIKPVAFHQLL